ncbi:MAG: radical SAM protein [Flavobacteriales bacterium]|nr:radical SAM protein [Flavobacteriales bacterium]
MSYSIKQSILARLNNRRVKNEFKGIHPYVHPSNSAPNYVPLSKETVAKYGAARPRSEHVLCYAPFKNMYFGIDGSATACCYNRTHSFGSFPEQSIHEMWFGAKADELREHIKCNDLSKGCQGCQYLLNVGNYTGTQALYFDHYPMNKNKYPTVMQFELSNVCNLECTMCTGEFSSSIRKNREQLSEKICAYDDDFIVQLREFIPHLSYAKFYGGEPFLIEQYYKIWNLMAELNPGIKVEIQTNATIMNQRVKSVLDKLKCNINVSLDSLQKETYESIRTNAKFDTVQNNLQYFVDYSIKKRTKVTISVCPMRSNWEELPDFVNYANSIKGNLFFHVVWNPEDLALWNLGSVALGNMLQILQQVNLPRRTSVQRKNYRRYADYLELIQDWQRKALTKEEVEEQVRKEEERIKAERQLKLQAYHLKAQRYAPIIKEWGVRQTVISELRNAAEKNEDPANGDLDFKVHSYQQQLNWLSVNLPEEIIPDELFKAMLIQRPIENILAEFQKEDTDELLKTALEFADNYEKSVL